MCSDLLQRKYQFDKKQAGLLFSIPYMISAITSPFLGIMIDKFGRRALLITVSSIIFIISYSASMMYDECYRCYSEVYSLVGVGVGFSIYGAAVWGSVPYTVPPQAVGSAFGICTAIQNIGLVIAPGNTVVVTGAPIQQLLGLKASTSYVQSSPRMASNPKNAQWKKDVQP